MPDKKRRKFTKTFRRFVKSIKIPQNLRHHKAEIAGREISDIRENNRHIAVR
jgi:hypothetical protein